MKRVKRLMDRFVSVVIRLAPEVPETEFSFEFVQRMADAMSVSFFKYGAAPLAYPHKVNAIESLKTRLDLYTNGGDVKGKHVEPGNPSYLYDIGNFAMLEYRYPRHPGRALWDAQECKDSAATSPGRTHSFIAKDAEVTNDGLTQAERAAQSTDETKLLGTAVYKRQGD